MMAVDPGTHTEAALSCRRCEAVATADQRFCTDCGSPLGETRVAELDLPSDQVARLVECNECGAGNASSRPLCARCSAPLRDEVPGGDALPEDLLAPVAPPADDGPRRDAPVLIMSLVVLAALVTGGVLLSLLTSDRSPESPAVPTGVALQAASASTSLGEHPASLAIDGDPLTAWTEAAEGPGEEQWLEVTLGAQASVRRVLIWNGDQRDGTRFTDNGRASAVRIEVGDRQFRVAVLDEQGPQAVDLPEAVRSDRVRVVVEDAISGTRYTDLAISEIVVEGAP